MNRYGPCESHWCLSLQTSRFKVVLFCFAAITTIGASVNIFVPCSRIWPLQIYDLFNVHNEENSQHSQENVTSHFVFAYAAGVIFLSAWSTPQLRGVAFLPAARRHGSAEHGVLVPLSDAQHCQGLVAGGDFFLRSWENRSLQRAMGQKLRELESAESEHRTKVGIGGSGAATLNADFLAG